MNKIILSFLLIIYSLTGFADNIYKFYSHASGTYSVEINNSACVGRFSLNDYLLVSSEKIAQLCENKQPCHVNIIKGYNCQTNTLIGSGWTNIDTGTINMIASNQHAYYFTTNAFTLGLHPLSPPG